ncbi:hypothetical protein BDV26DRAFT_36530 [Aspergillus bertholletiae]|uniref:Uncharacterized protein n=1 Tax=Aspergillus bertholletiae TaxID=1226010 RepID=A0A5N7AXH6_9EURO|nr:hypothetical protein BDV26DRAFT_36530 [Aspergillus bertholletiae]
MHHRNRRSNLARAHKRVLICDHRLRTLRWMCPGLPGLELMHGLPSNYFIIGLVSLVYSLLRENLTRTSENLIHWGGSVNQKFKSNQLMIARRIPQVAGWNPMWQTYPPSS